MYMCTIKDFKCNFIETAEALREFMLGLLIISLPITFFIFYPAVQWLRKWAKWAANK
jgi:hypothetical protein